MFFDIGEYGYWWHSGTVVASARNSRISIYPEIGKPTQDSVMFKISLLLTLMISPNFVCIDLYAQSYNDLVKLVLSETNLETQRIMNQLEYKDGGRSEVAALFGNSNITMYKSTFYDDPTNFLMPSREIQVCKDKESICNFNIKLTTHNGSYFADLLDEIENQGWAITSVQDLGYAMEHFLENSSSNLKLTIRTGTHSDNFFPVAGKKWFSLEMYNPK
jgi:hypothetical protein